ncbi:NnrU family protein [Rivibacter subsaxonicus]|uniref:Putative membrane protein n=1 Tax=Rivibacter subsaxonicus TaxID=457575 RepID=A0A4Q7VWC2_9BURK|nr:NnrU family protein [Rivibacter subsaxonicus]RZU01024.1 putative membrane protein [Rivibacter subsaxonicus]
MSLLILGLLLFLGMHSVRVLAEPLRSARIASMGERGWKGLYTVVSIVGLVLICWGYVLARQQPLVLWSPPLWTRHVAGLLMLVSFILLTAAEVPGNAIKHRLQHPMLLGTKVWAFAHLLANGTLADLLLFGSFLVWAILAFRSARRRGEARGRAPTMGGTMTVIVVGIGLWLVFAFWAHRFLIGVSPFGS